MVGEIENRMAQWQVAMSEVQNSNCFPTIEPFFVITAWEAGPDKPYIRYLWLE